MVKVSNRKPSISGGKPGTMKTMTAMSAAAKKINARKSPSTQNKNNKRSPTEIGDNPFDRFANARKKHEVLNRRVKGEDRNVGRARAQAVDARKQKLLKDYHSNKKSNVIIDRRFGEDDPTMSLEEKMFLRFQREKTKKLRRSTAAGFNLQEGSRREEELLTHKGRILGESNLNDRDWHSSDDGNDSDDDAGGRLGKEVVNSLHFGGGLQLKRPPQQQGQPLTADGEGNDQQQQQQQQQTGPKRGRLDALQEIVMKSKLHKMQRKEMKEEQEEETMKLDEEYDALVKSTLLDFAAPGENKRRAAAAAAASASGAADEYDIALREMAFEAKVQASDRTKTPEELALEQQQRIEQLEAARLQRMRRIESAKGDGNDPEADADAAAADAVLGNVSAPVRRDRFGNTISAAGGSVVYNGKVISDSRSTNGRRQRTDDEIDDFDYEPPKKANKQQTAFGRSFAPTAAAADDEEEEAEDSEAMEDSGDKDDDDDDDDDEDVEEEDDDGDSDDDDEDDSEENVADDDFVSAEQLKATASNDDEDDDDDASESSTDSAANGDAVEIDEYGVNLMMPHKIDCPLDVASFDELCEQFVTHPLRDFTALVDRILAWNSVHLPGTRGAENRNHMHNFLDTLLKCFIREGDALESAKAAAQKTLTRKLDYLTGVIFNVSQDLGDAPSTSLWLRTLKIIRSQFEKRMRDYGVGVRNQSCWPSLGRLLLLRIAGKVFSVTDLKNDVTQYASILLCQCLAQCPVTGVADVASGLMACATLLSYATETERLFPEVATFLSRCLSLFLPADSAAREQLHSSMLNTFHEPHLDWMRQAAATATATAAASEADAVKGDSMGMKLPWRVFAVSVAKSRSLREQSMTRHAQLYAKGVISTVYVLIETLVSQHASDAALPELLETTVDMLMAVRPHDPPKMDTQVMEKHAELLQQLRTVTAEMRRSRAPLQWRRKQVQAIEAKAPRVQPSLVFKKDQEEDRDKAKLKQLTRQLKREKKAAMRELRRDSDFLAAERQRETDEAERVRKAQRHRNYAAMEAQQATINQQVKQGKGLMRGGGSGVTKTGRQKR